MNENSKPLSTVRPFGDPCAGDLITPVNSNIAVRSLINLLPMYRQGLSNRARGLQLGSFFGFVLYGPFTVLGPMRNSDYSTTIGLFSTIGGVSILTTLFFFFTARLGVVFISLLRIQQFQILQKNYSIPRVGLNYKLISGLVVAWEQ